MTDAYKAAVEAFAQESDIPLIHFERGVRKDDLAAEYRARHGEREGVVFIGIAQERRQFLGAIDDSQPVPLPLAAAFEQVEQAVAELVNGAHLAPSAA